MCPGRAPVHVHAADVGGIVARARPHPPVTARATELVGGVVAPPFDAPWVRMTILTDPQGATFTASKFVPPRTRTGNVWAWTCDRFE